MKSNVIISFLGRMLTIPKNQGRGKEVPEPRPLQRLRRRKIPLITKPLCQPQNQGQKSNQRSKKPLQRKKNMSMLYSSVMSVSSSISIHFLSNWLIPYCGLSWIIGISKHLWFRYCYCKKNWKKFLCSFLTKQNHSFQTSTKTMRHKRHPFIFWLGHQ